MRSLSHSLLHDLLLQLRTSQIILENYGDKVASGTETQHLNVEVNLEQNYTTNLLSLVVSSKESLDLHFGDAQRHPRPGDLNPEKPVGTSGIWTRAEGTITKWLPLRGRSKHKAAAMRAGLLSWRLLGGGVRVFHGGD